MHFLDLYNKLIHMKEYKLNQIAHKRILGRNVYKNDDEALTLFWGGAALEVNKIGRAHV